MLRAKADFGGLVRFDDLTTMVNDPQLAGQVLLDREQNFAIRENFRGEVLSEAEIAETAGSDQASTPACVGLGP